MRWFSICLLLFVFLGCGDDDVTDASPPDATIDAALESCGTVTCGPGLVCCNPSCGTCVMPGQTCITLECAGDAGMDAPVQNTDTDNDGILDLRDNCVSTANQEQRDFDGDRIGDLCDRDADGDGTEDGALGEEFLLRAQVLDYFVQDVCLNERYEVVAEDPRTCVGEGRFLRNHLPDEKVPYVLADNDAEAFDETSIRSSRQLRLLSGGRGTALLLDTAAGSSAYFQADRARRTFPFPRAGRRDELQVLELNGNRVSRIYAEGTIGVVRTFSDSTCLLEDATILVDATNVEEGEPQTNVYRTRSSLGDSCSTTAADEDRSTVSVLEDFEYDSGEVLKTLKVTEHFGVVGEANFSVSYYTREFGLVRTERWSSGDVTADTSCQETIMGGFTRTSCSEKLQFLPLDEPWDARVESIGVAHANLIPAGDMGSTVSNAIRTFADGNVALSIENEMGELASADNRFVSAIWNGIGASSFYIDVEVPSDAAGRFAFGATLWSGGTVKMELNQLAGDPPMLISTQSVDASLGEDKAAFESSFELDSNTEMLRLEFKLQDANVRAAVDDAFIVSVAE